MNSQDEFDQKVITRTIFLDGNHSVFESFRIFIFSSVLYSLYILFYYSYFLDFLDLKTKNIDFLDLKSYCFWLYFPKKCLKSLYFTSFLLNFFIDLFFRHPQIFLSIPIFFQPVYLVTLLLPIIFLTF